MEPQSEESIGVCEKDIYFFRRSGCGRRWGDHGAIGDRMGGQRERERGIFAFLKWRAVGRLVGGAIGWADRPDCA